MQDDVEHHALWNGRSGTGGISWRTRSCMGLLRGVIDIADDTGRRNEYIHGLHTQALCAELAKTPQQINRVLDFGCGTGRFLKLLASRCDAVYAIDRDASMIEAARLHAGSVVEQLSVWESDRVPFDDGYFDVIVCSSVLSITPSELFDRSLEEMSRILTPGGRLLMLEKVGPRKLTAVRYRQALEDLRFEAIRMYPVRSAASPMVMLITRANRIPRAMFPLLARLELLFMRNRTYLNPAPYVEYVIAAQKKRDTKTKMHSTAAPNA